MALLADNQMIMHRDIERFADLHDLVGQTDVVGGRLRITRWVVVHENQGAGAELERPAQDLPWIDGRMIDGAGAQHLIGDEAVLLVEEQHV